MTNDYFRIRHGYEVNGFWYPRVTSICGIIAKPGLEKWLANQKSFSAMQEKRRKIVNWGSLVHDTIGKILLGRLPKVDPAISPSIDAFLRWFKRHRVDVFGIEKRVVSDEHFYCGTLDVLAEIDGKLGILDLKTSKDIYEDYFVQTAGYFQAYNEKVDKKAKTCWILRIDQYQLCELCGAKKREKGGESEIKPDNRNCSHKWGEVKGIFRSKEINDPKMYVETFLTAKKLWEFSNRRWLSKIKNYSRRENKQVTSFPVITA